MMKGTSHKFGPCNVKVLHVSNMARAKETSNIIVSQLLTSQLNPDMNINNDVSAENKDDNNSESNSDSTKSRRAEVINPEIASFTSDPDPDLNEGKPCHNIPSGGIVSQSSIQKVDECKPRIERAFLRYFYRAPPPSSLDTKLKNNTNEIKDDKDIASNSNLVIHELEGNSKNGGNKKATAPDSPLIHNQRHEFEIIVCHANVIRYFLCRALQLPPEAWLRFCVFNCSLTYLTVRPTGTVSCRMVGDIGHLGYDKSTFSMHHGFNW